MIVADASVGEVYYKIYKARINFYFIEEKLADSVTANLHSISKTSGSHRVVFRKYSLDNSNDEFRLLTKDTEKKALRKLFGVFND